MGKPNKIKKNKKQNVINKPGSTKKHKGGKNH
mgnify:CR=1 FL=1